MIIDINLKNLREFKGYSQQYMASKLNISQPSYSEIERNNSKTTIDKYEIISKELGISLENAIRHKIKVFIYIYNDSYPPIEKSNIERALEILTEQNAVIKKIHLNMFKKNLNI